MRGIKLATAVVAVCAMGALYAASAAALPLFVSKSGKYPIHGSFSQGLVRFDTATKEIHCASGLGLISQGLRLALLLILYHKCSTTLFLSSTECNTAGEPKGLIHVHQHVWLGYLTNASGEKMVALLTQPLSGNTDAEFECSANAFEHAKITVLGEAVGAIPAANINVSLAKFRVRFEESSQGKQTPQSFLLPSPLSLMTGVHTTWDISGSINEKTETAELAEGEFTLDGGETAEIQG